MDPRNILHDFQRQSITLQRNLLWRTLSASRDFPGGSVIKNLPATWVTGSIHGLGRSPGEGNGNPIQCSCLENPMDRGAFWATVQGVIATNTLSASNATATPPTLARQLRFMSALLSSWLFTRPLEKGLTYILELDSYLKSYLQ